MRVKERYITDEHGNYSDVVLTIEEYKKILTDLEELESIRAYDVAKSSNEKAIPFEKSVFK